LWIEQQPNPREPRRKLLEEFYPLGTHQGIKHGKSGDISAWLAKRRGQAKPDWIGDRREYDWYCAGFARERLNTGSRVSHQDVWPCCHQLCCQGPEALSVATPPAIFNLKIATYRPSQILELLLKCRDAGLGFRVGFNKT
jgi:hypothetical protein